MIEAIDIQSADMLTLAPRFGYQLIASRNDFSGYWHEKRAMGGDWAASFEVFGSEDFLLGFFEVGMMGKVGSYSGTKRCWHGFINSMTLETPYGAITKSMDDVYNRVYVRYQTTSGTGADITETVQQFDGELLARMQADMGGGSVATRSGSYSDTDSISRYGRKDLFLSAGTCTAGVAAQVAQAALIQKAYPSRKPRSISLGGRERTKTRLTVGCKGWVQTLDWRAYNYTASSGLVNASEQVRNIVTWGASEFVPTALVVENTTQVEKKRDADRMILPQIIDIARLGDSSFNRWVVYSIDTTLYYEPAASTDNAALRYSVKRIDGESVLFEYTASPLSLELVDANEYIRVEQLSNFKAISDQLDQDPSVAYIESLVYRDPGVLEISGRQNDILDVSLKRISLGGNSNL